MTKRFPEREGDCPALPLSVHPAAREPSVTTASARLTPCTQRTTPKLGDVGIEGQRDANSGQSGLHCVRCINLYLLRRHRCLGIFHYAPQIQR